MWQPTFSATCVFLCGQERSIRYLMFVWPKNAASGTCVFSWPSRNSASGTSSGLFVWPKRARHLVLTCSGNTCAFCLAVRQKRGIWYMIWYMFVCMVIKSAASGTCVFSWPCRSAASGTCSPSSPWESRPARPSCSRTRPDTPPTSSSTTTPSTPTDT